MMRPEVEQLIAMGALPESKAAAENAAELTKYERLLRAIPPPLTDKEAEALTAMFGPDDCFGLAWALVHLIESAPRWTDVAQSLKGDGQWIALLRDRARRDGPTGHGRINA